jgi:predicted nucleic acid-binding protein
MSCLDNDVFSRYASRQSYPAVSEFLSAHSSEPWLIPFIVLFEYLHQYSSQNTIQKQRRNAEQSVDGVIPVDGDVSEQAANIRTRLDAAGRSSMCPTC